MGMDFGVLDRLEDLIDQETAALRSNASADLKDFNNRKSHALLELTRAMRDIPGQPDAAILARMSRLRAKLDENRKVLQMHVEAVREITSVVSEAMQNAESDGTYSGVMTQAGLYR